MASDKSRRDWNRQGRLGDHLGVECERWLDAISASADGEDPGLDPRLIDAHVAQCAACAEFRGGLEVGRGRQRLAAAEHIPDISRQVATRAAAEDRAGQPAWLRWFLALLGLQIMVLSAPALLLGNESGTSPHGARHLGAFSVAYAVGLLVVAVRPARARTLLPVAQVLVFALSLSAIVGFVDGSIRVAGEVSHLPEVFSLVGVWLLTRPGNDNPFRRLGGSGPSSGVSR